MNRALPVIVFLPAWGILDRRLLLGLGLVLLVGFFASRDIRTAFWAPTKAANDASAAPVMARSRLLIVYALGTVILGGSAFDSVTDTEHWPFSQYPMFSMVATQRSFTMLRMYGVSEREPLSEFPLEKNEYLEPFDNSRMPDALSRAIAEHQLIPALEDCLKRYEALRTSGIHHGPVLRGLRLYRVTWTAGERAGNVDTPDDKELLGEITNAVFIGQRN